MVKGLNNKQIRLGSQFLKVYKDYHIYPVYSESQAGTICVDPDQMPQNVASDQGLHCLPLIQQFLDTSTDSKIDLFRFHTKYGKELRCPNI